MTEWLWFFLFISSWPFTHSISSWLFDRDSIWAILSFVIIVLANIAGAIFVVVGLLVYHGVIVPERPVQHAECTTTPGQKVRWVSGDKGQFAYVELDDTHFCWVNHSTLAQMGPGYETTKSYRGWLLERP